MKLTHAAALAYFRTLLNIMAVVSKRKAAQQAFRLFCTPFPRSEKRVSAVFDEAEKLHMVLDNNKIVGYRWNHPGTKKVLILHGFRSSAKNFERYVMPLVNKGYEVLAFDAPAHGESEGRQTNVRQYINLIEEVYHQYGPVNAYVAHSFGGLAASLALEDLSHTDDTRLALIAPATETTTAIDFFFRLLHLNKNLREEFNSIVARVEGQPAEWYSIARVLPHIRASILWVHDENDTITPFTDVQPVINAKHANIQFMITRGWGHRRIYHEQTVINAVEAFI